MFLAKSKKDMLLTSYFLLLMVTSFDVIFLENIPSPQIYSVIKLADELYIIVLFSFTLLSKKGRIPNEKLLLMVFLFCVMGFVGNARSQSTVKVALLGAFTTIKPILLFWSMSQYDFEWKHFYNFIKKFNFIFPLIVVSYIFDFFIPSFRRSIGIISQAEDIRMGMRSLGGLFNKFTNGILFALIYYISYRFYLRSAKWKYYFAAFMVIASFKIKDIFGFFVGNTLLSFHQFKKRYLVVIAIGLMALFNVYATLMPEHYGAYIGNKDRSNIARVVLYETSLKIIVDEFPFGVGHGMYASPISQQYKSDIYRKYGIDDVYGLSYRKNDDGAFMTDTFWPMIIGETGFIGTVLYALILLYCFYPSVKGFFSNSRDLKYVFPAFLFFVFLLTSLGKPVFNGPPHCLVIWGFAGIFKSLQKKEYEDKRI